MYPAMTTDRSSRRPKRRRIVNASRRACVGCSCAPSPALTTPASRRRARKCGTPAEPCRMTIRSGDIACRFVAVSRSDSPFSVDVPFPALKLNESAESHFSAVAIEKRVRVEGSKKRLATIRPRSAGTFLISRWPIDRIDSAVSRMSEISSGSSSPIPRRSFERSAATFGGGGVKASGSPTPGADAGLRARLLQDPDFVGAVGLGEHHLDDLALRGRDALADVVRLDRELPVPPVDQDREADGAGTPEVDDAVESRANRPAGVEDVVAQQHRSLVQIELDLGLLQNGLRGDGRQIVAVERDVERSDGKRLPHEVRKARRKPRRQRDAARADADEREAGEVLLALGDFVRHPVDHPADALRVEDLRLFEKEGLGQ